MVAAEGLDRVDEGLVERVAQRALAVYDKGREEHFNLISALHKAVRNSDVDAALYWLGRMLVGGADPRFVVRRMMRMASEDIGMADPRALEQAGVPRILFMKGCAPYLETMARSGADAIGLDWTVRLREALPRVGWLPVQGNLDPTVLFGDEKEIRRRARAICAAGDEAPGHVFNLGHGILPQAPIAAVEALVDEVHAHRRGGRR